MKFKALIVAFITFLSCSSQKMVTNNPQIFWVNSMKVSCTGVAPMKCLQIQKNDTMEKEKWEYFYSNIYGFNFESGFIYKLSVIEEKIDHTKIPADGSSIKYTLKGVLEKNPDPKFRIHDIWALEALDGVNFEKPKENDRMTHPTIEVNLSEMKLMGNDGCNNFFGAIKSIDDDMISFGPLGSTMKMCVNMEITAKFNNAFNKISKYKIENMKLSFFDETGNELLRFKKVD